MKAYIGVTDSEWFNHLRNQHYQQELNEVNFWQPSGRNTFRALAPGELFLFKLHSPDNYIVGGGVFAHGTLLPISLVWDAFTTKNGVSSFDALRKKILRFRQQPLENNQEDFTIGCIVLTQPFFLPRKHWIPVPADWSGNIVRGKKYDLSEGLGAKLYQQIQKVLVLSQPAYSQQDRQPDSPKYGEPMIIRPRLGQGAFRVVVTDAYNKRCSVTGEKVLPALEAAHIKPYASGGIHAIDNGLLLRSDLHRLFDRGYLTINPNYQLEVSKRIHDDFGNGRDYYALDGKKLRPPKRQQLPIAKENIQWHNDHVYLG